MPTVNSTTTPSGLMIDSNTRGFNGQLHDAASNTYLLGNGYRAYSPVLRTFYSADSLSPFGAAGINRYQYCQLDPINFVDPTGHISWQAGVGIGLGVAGLLLSGITLGSSLALLGSGAALAGSLGVASAVLGAASASTGIASAALEDSDPETSAALGWASLGLGLGSLATGLTASGVTYATRTGRLFGGTPSTLYRGDLRRLSEIERAGGFSGLGKNTSISTHLSGRNAGYSASLLEKSAYSSFTGSRSIAADFAGQRIASGAATQAYVYQVSSSGVKFINPAQRLAFSHGHRSLVARSMAHQEFLAKNVPFKNITLLQTLGGI
ncbi:hypothetical protein KBJ94_27865 [Pseudomonas sp. ITA]|uniref:RHS repeat-associated core domain-containing protein n=1 Tax=Pseudomonas sp. ITA TaxID=2825841 RepID=UPI0024987111|nr:RHS repeat-associated core domain-containing protein [Pseudomonas sp. ITA]MDI2145866.1 hypothetical protein [Pseudomonas sp. ITA]